MQYRVFVHDISGTYNKHLTQEKPQIYDGMLYVSNTPQKQLVYNLDNVISYKIVSEGSNEED